MLRRVLVVICVVILGGDWIAMPGVASVDADGTSAAAHACMQGGYTNLLAVDGTRFTTVGECVSYAAHGGTLVSVPACTVVGGLSGCVIIDHLTLPNVGYVNPALQGSTITLTGIFRFPTNCAQIQCLYQTPNDLGVGAGVYSIRSSGGALLASGTFTVTGIRSVSFKDVNGNQANCGPLPAIDFIRANIDLNDTVYSTAGTGQINVMNIDGTLISISLSSMIAGTYFVWPGDALRIQC